MKEFILLFLYPVSVLVLILGWLVLMRHNRSDTRIALKGLGISIEVSTNNGFNARKEEKND